MRALKILIIAILISGCTTSMTQPTASLNTVAERYVRLVLAMGEHDADYVDAYYGPPEWREIVKTERAPLQQVYDDALALRRDIAAIAVPSDKLLTLRHEYIRRQTEAVITRAEMLRGRKFTFDEESQALYDAVSPAHPESHFQSLLQKLEGELPGDGALTDRIEAFRKGFVIPKDRLDAVFQRAIEGCKERTLQHIELPSNESFTVEYVTNKSWSGYNWYQGNNRSLIQVNTDLPIYIDRAIDLACHEGYPGHHVYNVLLEKHLFRDRGWVEYSVYPLFSPQSLIAEGSANYGIEIAFPGAERPAWEKQHLFPIAGLDASQADRYYRVQDLIAKTSYAGNEAARRYLNGEWTADRAVEWLVRYGLYSPDRARQRVKFMDQYRSYVINYNLGKDLVREYVQRHAGNDPKKRWEVFEELLSTPRLPSALKK